MGNIWCIWSVDNWGDRLRDLFAIWREDRRQISLIVLYPMENTGILLKEKTEMRTLYVLAYDVAAGITALAMSGAW